MSPHTLRECADEHTPGSPGPGVDAQESAFALVAGTGAEVAAVGVRPFGLLEAEPGVRVPFYGDS